MRPQQPGSRYLAYSQRAYEELQGILSNNPEDFLSPSRATQGTACRGEGTLRRMTVYFYGGDGPIASVPSQKSNVGQK